MEPSCPLGTTRCIPQAKFHQKPYNKSFIDQVCSVKMAEYWPRSFFASFMDLDFVSVHKHAKKELGQYPAILTSHLVNNPHLLFIMQRGIYKENHFLLDSAKLSLAMDVNRNFMLLILDPLQLPQMDCQAVFFNEKSIRLLGRVVGNTVWANPGLKVNRCIYFLCVKVSFPLIMFRVV